MRSARRRSPLGIRGRSSESSGVLARPDARLRARRAANSALVEPRGIESPATSMQSVADRRENASTEATKGDEKRRQVLASVDRTDNAIRAAAKIAINEGDPDRARALLDLLDAKPRGAVLTLAKGAPR